MGLLIDAASFRSWVDTALHAVLLSDILHLNAEQNSLRSFSVISEFFFISCFEKCAMSSYLSVCSASCAIIRSSYNPFIFKKIVTNSFNSWGNQDCREKRVQIKLVFKNSIFNLKSGFQYYW